MMYMGEKTPEDLMASCIAHQGSMQDGVIPMTYLDIVLHVLRSKGEGEGDSASQAADSLVAKVHKICPEFANAITDWNCMWMKKLQPSVSPASS